MWFARVSLVLDGSSWLASTALSRSRGVVVVMGSWFVVPPAPHEASPLHRRQRRDHAASMAETACTQEECWVHLRNQGSRFHPCYAARTLPRARDGNVFENACCTLACQIMSNQGILCCAHFLDVRGHYHRHRDVELERHQRSWPNQDGS